jgi:aspartyl/asparaginyl beta-hydroxylase (cupin superfamily)
MGEVSSIEAWLGELRLTFGSHGLSRIEDMIRIRAGMLVATPAPLQRTHMIHIPRLDSHPWHQAEAFPWHDRIKELIPSVRAELDLLLERGVSQPYVSAFDWLRHGVPAAAQGGAPRAVPTWPATAEDWSVFFLYRHGRWLEPNARWWPSARQLIELTPFSPGEGLCSIIRPNGRIQFHSSGCNAVLTCHLPLVVPEGCALQVGLEARRWTENRIIAFEDSYLHRAWNDSSEPRICLIWEIWHPGLTDLEVAALELLYPRLMDFEDNGTLP